MIEEEFKECWILCCLVDFTNKGDVLNPQGNVLMGLHIALRIYFSSINQASIWKDHS